VPQDLPLSGELEYNMTTPCRHLGGQPSDCIVINGAGVIMSIQGVIVGLVAFIVIGIFHPIVIKSEYYFGTKIWPLFLVAGVVGIALSVFVANAVISAILGVFGFAALWSIRELFEQAKRVRKGWFPKRPDRSVHGSES
jgi:hypothetical protein